MIFILFDPASLILLHFTNTVIFYPEHSAQLSPSKEEEEWDVVDQERDSLSIGLPHGWGRLIFLWEREVKFREVPEFQN